MRTTYQILSRGDFVSWHLSLARAIQRAEKLDEASIYEMPENGELPIDTYPCVWSIREAIAK